MTGQEGDVRFTVTIKRKTGEEEVIEMVGKLTEEKEDTNGSDTQHSS